MTEPTNKPRFELRHTQGVEVSLEELLSDLKRIAAKSGRSTVTSREYESAGRYSPDTVQRRFGSWNEALKQAGFDISNEFNINKDRLFENLERLWISLGRQPTRRELIKRSEFSIGPYMRAFGSWRKALQAFVEWANTDEASFNSEIQEVEENGQDEKKFGAVETEFKHKTKRNISERLKVQVLMRDGNKCKLCDITVTGENIHFDHIKPWSKGGETVLENLQVLCATHNLAKGNLEYNKK